MSVQCHFHFYYFSSCFVFDFLFFLFLLLALGTHGGRRRALSLPLPSIKAPPRRFFAFFFFWPLARFALAAPFLPTPFFLLFACARSGAPPKKTPIKTHGRRGDCWAPPPRARALARDATRRTAATKFKRVCYFSLFIRREGRAKSARGAERRGAPNGRTRAPARARLRARVLTESHFKMESI